MKEVIDKIFNNEDYKMVYFELGKYLNTNEYKEKRKLQNELFIKYLQAKHPQNINEYN